MDRTSNELQAERDQLEHRLLALEQAAEQQRQRRLMAAEAEDRQAEADLMVGVNELLAKLAVVNTQLARRRTPSAPQKARAHGLPGAKATS